jgi:hypothetical protein
MKSLRILAAFVLCVLLIPIAQAQTSACTVAQGTVKFKNAAGTVSDWWPNVSTRPTGGSVDVVGGSLSVPLLFVKPAPAQIKAGVAPDAAAFCFPLAKLARGDELAVMMIREGVPVKVVTCRFETGDAYNFRMYGTPPKKLATFEPRVVAADASGKSCEAALQ